MPKDKLSLRVELENENVEQFLEIKRRNAFKTNTQTIRYCINQTFNSANISISSDLQEIIENLITKQIVRTDHGIFSIEDFIRQAVERYIKVIRENIKSIQDWDVRSKLPEEELEIALAIIETQSKHATEEVTVSEIASNLETRNVKRIEEIMNDFVNRGILDRRKGKKEFYYHARK